MCMGFISFLNICLYMYGFHQSLCVLGGWRPLPGEMRYAHVLWFWPWPRTASMSRGWPRGMSRARHVWFAILVSPHLPSPAPMEPRSQSSQRPTSEDPAWQSVKLSLQSPCVGYNYSEAARTEQEATANVQTNRIWEAIKHATDI